MDGRGGWSTVGGTFAWHMSDPGLIPIVDLIWSQSLPGPSPEKCWLNHPKTGIGEKAQKGYNNKQEFSDFFFCSFSYRGSGPHLHSPRVIIPRMMEAFHPALPWCLWWDDASWTFWKQATLDHTPWMLGPPEMRYLAHPRWCLLSQEWPTDR